MHTIELTTEYAPTSDASSALWHRDAACSNGTTDMVDLFFSDEPGEISQAKAVCAGCPVLAQCLEAALDRREQFGVWGGQLFIAGRIHLTKRAKGRPPKSPRPSDLIPLIEVPVHLRDHVERITEIGNGFPLPAAA